MFNNNFIKSTIINIYILFKFPIFTFFKYKEDRESY